jgi:hypothetical protein
LYWRRVYFLRLPTRVFFLILLMRVFFLTSDVDDLVPARVDRHCSVLSDYETDSLVIIVVDTSDEGLLLDTPDVDDLMPALVVEGGIVLDINVYRFLCT